MNSLKSSPNSTAAKLVILGAGGHGRVVLDACRSADHRVVGFLDASLPAGSVVNGCSVLGNDTVLDELDPDIAVVVAIGDQGRRRALALSVLGAGRDLARVVHAAAWVSDWAQIDAGTVVFACAIVNANAAIGLFCIVNSGAIVEHDCRLADGVHIGPGAQLGADVQLAEGVFIGAGATVVPGISIGTGAVVGAGAVVTHNLPPGVTAVGVPARVVKQC